MSLVDTSVWIDHLRSGDEILAGLFDEGQELSHPFIIGELTLGHLRQRGCVLAAIVGGGEAAVVGRAHGALTVLIAGRA